MTELLDFIIDIMIKIYKEGFLIPYNKSNFKVEGRGE